MTNDNGTAQGDGQGEQAPPPIDIASLLSDETKADEPVKIGDLRSYLERRDGEVLETASRRFRDEQAARERALHENEERAASAKTDIDFATSIEDRLRSADEAVRAQANLDMESNRDRYRRGMALAYQRDSQERRDAAISEHVTPLWAEVKAQLPQFNPLLDKIASDPAEFARLAGGTNNWIRAILAGADEMGYERGKAEAAANAEQDERIRRGTELPPRQVAPGGGALPGLTDGIDRSKPGGAAEVFRRVADQRKRA